MESNSGQIRYFDNICFDQIDKFRHFDQNQIQICDLFMCIIHTVPGSGLKSRSASSITNKEDLKHTLPSRFRSGTPLVLTPCHL